MRMSFKSVCPAVVAAATLLGAISAARAEEVPTNLPGVGALTAPPVTLDPIRAAPEVLQAYGLPPRPDKVAEPRAFEAWQRAVTSGARRIVPTLQRTNIRHRRADITALRNGNATSSNWSGYVLSRDVASYGATSFSSIGGDFVVPFVRQAFGACTGGWTYASEWVGLDGLSNNDVLQAGVETDAYCSGRSTSSLYAAWYEWYPDYEIRINGLTVAAGDVMSLHVWATSATVGHLYMINLSTNTSVSLSFTPPSGTSLIGSSAEWIVERPEIGGNLATLANYTQDFWEGATTSDVGHHGSQPGAPAAGVSATNLVMVDDADAGISYARLLGNAGLWFYAANSARSPSSP